MRCRASREGIRRGWCLGSAEFKTGLLEHLEGRLGEQHAGELKRESAESKAERIIREELKRLKWGQNDLSQRPKSDPAKLSIAARLRRETTLTLPRIAARLEMGSWKSPSFIVGGKSTNPMKTGPDYSLTPFRRLASKVIEICPATGIWDTCRPRGLMVCFLRILQCSLQASQE